MIHGFAAALPFLKVIGAFILMLFGIRNKLGLALSILLGGVVMGLLSGMKLAGLVKISLLAVRQEQFLFLATIVALILILSDAQDRSGQSRRLMAAISGYLVNPRLRLIFFPALIGLLPMPGGAVFSAPMVKTVSEGMAMRDEDRAVINYWFRHVWELAWPLYPGVILTVSLAGIPVGTFIACTWPGILAMFALGWFFFLRPEVLGVGSSASEELRSPGQWRVVLREGLPLLIAIIGAVGLETLISRMMPGVSFEWGVIVALLLAVFSIMVQNRLGWAFLLDVLAKKSLWTMISVVVAIFMFKDIMGAAGIVKAMAQSSSGGVALFAAAFFLPFLVGMVAGINVAFVGATFPLLLGLLNSLGLQEQMIAYLVLASFAGFTGVMISPIHICFLLNCNYFGVDLGQAWRRLVLPCLLFALCGGLLFWILL
jgi:integral membrane protein (TIGR00529 family)